MRRTVSEADRIILERIAFPTSAMPASPAPLQFEQRDNVGFVRLARAAKRNALSDALVLALQQRFETLPEGVKAVVLEGEGPHFCAGLDLAELTERSTAEGLLHSMMWHAAFDRVQYGKAPVIAVLRGAVIGGGLELACAAHLRVAERSAFYALPEGQRGLFVGGGGSVRLPRIIGAARMTDLMLTGRVYDAAEGHAAGLSHYLVEDGEGLAKATELAQRIAGNAPLTNFAVTQVLPRIADQPMTEGLLMESMMAAIASGSEDAKRLLRAFLDKRGGKVTAPEPPRSPGEA
jgi:enoyl-CoA hydratase/carnithine racemase